MSETQESAPFDVAEFRRALGSFATGVTVVTTIDETGLPRGLTANSFTSVSLQPPLILFCVAKSASTCALFEPGGSFAVNVLAENQRHFSIAFSAQKANRFEAVNWSAKSTGAPIIDGVAAWFDCTVREVVDGGDHAIIIGNVQDFGRTGLPPLGYCQGAYVTFGLSHEAVEAAGEGTSVYVGAIVEYEGGILLARDAKTGSVRLPTATKFGPKEDRSTLHGRLAAEGIEAELAFLYALFEEKLTRNHYIFYRGEARRVAERARERFVPFAEIPFQAIEDKAVRAMLKRYVKERQDDVWGVYVGDTITGQVQQLVTD